MIVVWRVTEQCNLSCPFCHYDRTLRRGRRESDPQQVLAFGAVLSEYARTTEKRVLVSWLGGEPLLWPPLQGLTRIFHREYGLDVSATTNGTPLAAESVRRHVLTHFRELTVSVDALGAAHESLRGWRGGFSILRSAVRSISATRKRSGSPLRLRINVVLMRDTIAEFEPLCAELASWGVDEITFNQLGGNDRPEFYPANRILPEQFDAFAAALPRLRDQLASTGVALRGGGRYLARLAATCRDVQIPISECDPGTRFVFIDEAGLAAPCSFSSAAYGIPISEMTGVRELLQLPERFRDQRRRQLHPACADCHCTHVFEKFAA